MQAVLEALPHEFQQFREVVESLAKLVLQCRLFPGRHPSMERACSAAYMHVDAALQGKSSITLVFSKGVMCWLNFEIDMTESHDQAMHLLRESLARQSIRELEFRRGVTKDEIASLASLLAGTAARKAGAVAVLAERIEKIRVAHAYRTEESAKPRESSAARPVAEVPLKRPGASAPGGGGLIGKVVMGVLERLEKIQSKDGTTARATIMDIIEREGGATATILLLNSLREYDDYTFTHSVNVAVISAAIARRLGLGEDFIDTIAHAALLHDIGKLYVPRAIIHKAGRLTPSEWQKMKRHPVDGERILREEGLDLVSRRVAYEHHMRHDLTGYPAATKGFEVHKASEIVRIADSYDALTTKRPYRRQIDPYEAIRFMEQGSGREFRADYFLAFMRALGNIPIGSMLRLDTGETAVVIGVSPAGGTLPRVRLLRDASGRDVPDDIVLDLNELDPETKRPKRMIAEILDDAVRDVDVGRYLLG